MQQLVYVTHKAHGRLVACVRNGGKFKIVVAHELQYTDEAATTASQWRVVPKRYEASRYYDNKWLES